MEPSTEELRRTIVDEEHLKLLTLGYWISAGVDALFTLFGAFYAAMGVGFGVIIANIPPSKGQAPPPEFMKWIFVLFGAVFFVFFSHSVFSRSGPRGV
jgi:hypothetical protein